MQPSITFSREVNSNGGVVGDGVVANGHALPNGADEGHPADVLHSPTRELKARYTALLH